MDRQEESKNPNSMMERTLSDEPSENVISHQNINLRDKPQGDERNLA
jgi:hypothetical protein